MSRSDECRVPHTAHPKCCFALLLRFNFNNQVDSVRLALCLFFILNLILHDEMLPEIFVSYQFFLWKFNAQNAEVLPR